jgi:hypothetical protein
MASIVTKWCQPGKEQYSIELLDQLDPHEKSLMKVAEKNKNKEGKNIPSQIVINHFTQQYPRPKWLRGPWSIDYLVGDTPNGIMRIYNLHDSHLLPEKCGKGTMDANNWIIQVLQSADVFVDVFVESAPPIRTFFGSEYQEETLKLRPGSLSNLVKRLGSCIREREDCPAPNTRIHGVDVRQIGRVLQAEIREAYPDPETSDATLEESIPEVINMAVGIFASVKMQKQIQDLPKCIFEKLIGKFTENLRDCLLNINDSDMTYRNQIASLTICIGSVLMDIYLLGRLFKTFDTTEERGKTSHVSNAIIYTGADHAAEYRDLLESCGFRVVFENSSSGYKDQCVDISEMPYPLFRG